MTTNWNPSGPFNPTPAAQMPPMAPMSAPRPRMGLKRATRAFFQNYARFDGRAGRSETWWALLGIWLATLAIVLVGGIVIAIDSKSTPLATVVVAIYLIWALAIVVPSLALQVRRLHDTNQSGWLLLLDLVPFFGGIIILGFMCSASRPEGARFDRATQPAAGD